MTLALFSPAGSPLAVRDYARISKVLDVPNLIRVQIQSFQWLQGEGIAELLQELSPIADFTGNRFELRFLAHEFREPKHSERECREKEITYDSPLYLKTQLVVKETGEIKEQWLFFGDIPQMTSRGTFIINGAERVVVSQLVRSPGAYFTVEEDAATERRLCYAKLIPYRGAWLEFETSARNTLMVKIDRKHKAPVTTFLKALGFAHDEEILDLFKNVETDAEQRYIQTTLEKYPLDTGSSTGFKSESLKELWARWHPNDPFDKAAAQTIAVAQLDFYRRLRPGEPPSLENARAHLDNLFFNPRRYDLGKVGRYKLNRRLGLDYPLAQRTPTASDLIAIVRQIIRINNGQSEPDDIDHLGNRRVRAVGELIQNQLRVGFVRMERVIKERMTIVESAEATPAALVNIRPVVAAVREFFGGSQLSQFMDQTNPLAELTHKRRLSALGPGGLSRERAGFDVRDVHHSHYGRICPIETPEGPNIGLLGSLATYARINEFGFLETPYRRVHKELPNTDRDLIGRALRQDVLNADRKVVARAGQVVDETLYQRLRRLAPRSVPVRPFVSSDPKDIFYLSADEEEQYVIAQANVAVNGRGEFVAETVEARVGSRAAVEPVERVDYMDVAPVQIVSVSTALIPFLEHDDANRALMGSNMQRQAVPLLHPEVPLVGTGMERRVAMDSGQVTRYLDDLEGAIQRFVSQRQKELQAEEHTPEEARQMAEEEAERLYGRPHRETSAAVTTVSGNEVVVSCRVADCPLGGRHAYPLVKFMRSNQSTCVNQHPIVWPGQVVEAGQPLADSSSTDQGALALGHNALVAFMSWEGYNFEDAVIVSEALVRDDRFTSIHIEKYECEARDTKLGPEEITRDIPNVGEDALRDLDENGVIRIGAKVEPGDILVGKITPKGETELSAEEKLLRAIFGEKARDVKDTSKRVPHGERGTVIDVRVLHRVNHDDLPPGVNQLVRVWVAQTRKLSVGDKMAGRHGNKGVISRVMPIEEMPFLAEGTPIEMILNPIGVPSRMNLGQVLETHLGWVARFLGTRMVSPVFEGARDIAIEDGLARVWFIQASGAVDQHNLDTPTIDWERVRRWLAQRGYSMERLLDESVVGEARHACLRIWLSEVAGENPEGKTAEELLRRARDLNRERSLAPPILGKMVLYDGRTGLPFDQPVTVGYIYIMKLIHLVEDKIHARSTGPYSLITQQPLGGKTQFGGQRFGEMEVWALEAYSATHNLQEMLTVKSDDVVGRLKTYEAVVKGEDITQPGIPESFQVLVKELQALGLSVELLNDSEEPVPLTSETEEPGPLELGGGLNELKL